MRMKERGRKPQADNVATVALKGLFDILKVKVVRCAVTQIAGDGQLVHEAGKFVWVGILKL